MSAASVCTAVIQHVLDGMACLSAASGSTIAWLPETSQTILRRLQQDAATSPHTLVLERGRPLPDTHALQQGGSPTSSRRSGRSSVPPMDASPQHKSPKAGRNSSPRASRPSAGSSASADSSACSSSASSSSARYDYVLIAQVSLEQPQPKEACVCAWGR